MLTSLTKQAIISEDNIVKCTRPRSICFVLPALIALKAANLKSTRALSFEDKLFPPYFVVDQMLAYSGKRCRPLSGDETLFRALLKVTVTDASDLRTEENINEARISAI